MRFVTKPSLAVLLGVLFSSSVAFGQEKPLPLTLPTPTSVPATLTLDQLRKGIETQRSELWAMEVEYVLRQNGTGASSLEYHFAMKGEKRLRFQTELEPKGPAYGQTYDDDDAQIYNRDTRLASIEKQKEAWIDLDFYADSIGIAVSDEDRARANSLTSQLANSALHWSVQPLLEVVDGAQCHVIASDSTKHRIWVDPQIGFAVRFQEVYQEVKDMPKAEWPLQSRDFYRDFEEVAPGVYLPRKIEIVAYRSVRSPQHTWNEPAFSQIIDVTKLSVGDRVHDGLFRFEFPPGTTVADRVSDRFYRVGNAGEELDMLVGKGLEELGKSRSAKSHVVVVINILVLLGFFAVFVYRRSRRATL